MAPILNKQLHPFFIVIILSFNLIGMETQPIELPPDQTAFAIHFLDQKGFDRKTKQKGIHVINTRNNTLMHLFNQDSPVNSIQRYQMKGEAALWFLYEIMSEKVLPPTAKNHKWSQENLDELCRRKGIKAAQKRSIRFYCYYLTQSNSSAILELFSPMVAQVISGISRQLHLKMGGQISRPLLQFKNSISDQASKERQNTIELILPWQIKHPWLGTIDYYLLVPFFTYLSICYEICNKQGFAGINRLKSIFS